MMLVEVKDDTDEPPAVNIESMFEHSLGSFVSGHKPLFSLAKKIWNPPTDVYETDEAIFIKIEVPGIDVEQLDIALKHNQLTVRGIRFEDRAIVDDATIHLVEIHYGRFERMFKLPESIKVDDVKAGYAEGFLRMTVAKLPATSESVSVEIDAD